MSSQKVNQSENSHIVFIGTDVISSKRDQAAISGKNAALGRAQAVIEFSLDGKISAANQNFLDNFSCKAEDILGQHHRLFYAKEEASLSEYLAFWGRLSSGEFNARTYRRIDGHGNDLSIQRSYNPVFDTTGKPYKVVKFAIEESLQFLRQRISPIASS